MQKSFLFRHYWACLRQCITHTPTEKRRLTSTESARGLSQTTYTSSSRRTPIYLAVNFRFIIGLALVMLTQLVSNAATVTATIIVTNDTAFATTVNMLVAEAVDGGSWTSVQNVDAGMAAHTGLSFTRTHNYAANSYNFILWNGSVIVIQKIMDAAGTTMVLPISGTTNACTSGPFPVTVYNPTTAAVSAYFKQDGVYKYQVSLPAFGSVTYTYTTNCQATVIDSGYVIISYPPVTDGTNITFTPTITTVTTTGGGGGGGQIIPQVNATNWITGTNVPINYANLTDTTLAHDVTLQVGFNAIVAKIQEGQVLTAGELAQLQTMNFNITNRSSAVTLVTNTWSILVTNTTSGVTSNQMADITAPLRTLQGYFTNQMGQLVAAFIQYTNSDDLIGRQTFITNAAFHKDETNWLAAVNNTQMTISTQMFSLISVMTNSFNFDLTNHSTVNVNVTNAPDARLTNLAFLPRLLTAIESQNDTNRTDAGGVESQAEAAASAGEAAIDTMIGSVPEMGGTVGSAPTWLVHIPAAIGGSTTEVNLNPLSVGWVADLAALCRFFIKWTLWLTLFYSIIKYCGTMTTMITQTAKTNGGNVALNSVRVGVAIGLVLVIVTIITYTVSWWTDRMENVFLDPWVLGSSEPVQNGFWLANQFFPLTEMVTISLVGLVFYVVFVGIAWTTQQIVRIVSEAI